MCCCDVRQPFRQLRNCGASRGLEILRGIFSMQRLGATGADAVGFDWTVDMAGARKRLGNTSVQVRKRAAMVWG
jgi:hypothetical protein